MVAIPSNVAPYITQAAKGTGLPESVVAAQVNDESGFRTGLVSSAGALGPYQFEPGTWAALGFPAGQENSWPIATQAYIRYMRQLLAQFGGDVRKALAAYNAGPGNVAAGYGYADSILSAAGQPVTLTSATGTATGGAQADVAGGSVIWPGQIVGLFRDLDSALGGAWNAATDLLSPAPWIRAAAGVGGVILLAFGLFALGKAVM